MRINLCRNADLPSALSNQLDDAHVIELAIVCCKLIHVVNKISNEVAGVLQMSILNDTLLDASGSETRSIRSLGIRKTIAEDG